MQERCRDRREESCEQRVLSSGKEERSSGWEKQYRDRQERSSDSEQRSREKLERLLAAPWLAGDRAMVGGVVF